MALWVGWGGAVCCRLRSARDDQAPTTCRLSALGPGLLLRGLGSPAGMPLPPSARPRLTGLALSSQKTCAA